MAFCNFVYHICCPLLTCNCYVTKSIKLQRAPCKGLLSLKIEPTKDNKDWFLHTSTVSCFLNPATFLGPSSRNEVRPHADSRIRMAVFAHLTFPSGSSRRGWNIPPQARTGHFCRWGGCFLPWMTVLEREASWTTSAMKKSSWGKKGLQETGKWNARWGNGTRGVLVQGLPKVGGRGAWSPPNWIWLTASYR